MIRCEIFTISASNKVWDIYIVETESCGSTVHGVCLCVHLYTDNKYFVLPNELLKV